MKIPYEFLDFLESTLWIALTFPIICIIFLISKITNTPLE